MMFTDRLAPASARQLTFDVTSTGRFVAANRLWHSVLPHIGAPNTMKVCYAAWFDGECFAVAAWSNPVARQLPQQTWLELRRFAIAPDAPRYTASRMLGWMARHIRATLPNVVRLMSYQDTERHSGTIYRAAGWTPVEVRHGGPWSNRTRWNRTAERRRVIRWERELE